MAEQEKEHQNSVPETPPEERQRIEEEYKKRGAQSIPYKEYIALREKKKNRKKISIPLHIKFILGTPFLILFGYGVFFIPWVLYMVMTSPEDKADTKKEKTAATDDKDRTKQAKSDRR